MRDVITDLDDGGHRNKEVVFAVYQHSKSIKNFRLALIPSGHINDVQQYRRINDNDRAHPSTPGLAARSDSSHTLAFCLRASEPRCVLTNRSSAPEVIKWPSGP